MSVVRRGTLNASRGARGPLLAPPKKSSTVVVVVVVIVIAVALVASALALYFLWWRRRSTNSGGGTSTTGGKCTKNADCTSGKVCNTVSGVCVGCLTDANCSGSTPVCNQTTATCVAGCVTSADCSGGTPVCDTGNKVCVGCLADEDCSGGTPVCKSSNKTCVACLTNANCSGLTPICDSNNTCVECLSNLDCVSPATCQGGACCDISPPVSFSIISCTRGVPGNDAVSFQIAANYSQPVGSLQASILLYDDNQVFLAESNTFTPDEPNQFVTSLTFPPHVIFSSETYFAKLKISGTCGSTPFTAQTSTFQSFTLSSGCFPNITNVVSTSGVASTRTISVTLSSGSGGNAYGFTVKLGNTGQTNANDFDYIFRDVTGTSTYSGFQYDLVIPAGPTINVGTAYTYTWFQDDSSCLGPPTSTAITTFS
jgi:hypothetical protein